MPDINFTRSFTFLLLLSLIILLGCDPNSKNTNSEDYIKDINDQRAKKYNELIDTTTSRFDSAERAKFEKKKLSYFKPDVKYNIDANFMVDTTTPVFEMSTTTDRKPVYRIYGYLNFSVKDTSCRLTVYQNVKLKDHPEHGGYLFIPFKDNTNEFATYGGGRYIDIEIPEERHIKLDFNMAYNPYCAYNDRWSCPLVPFENHLDVSIMAGEKKYK